MSMALLPSVRITSKISLLIATLADKDNPSSDALLSDNLSNSQETCRRVAHSFLMAHRGIYSARSCSVSKSQSKHYQVKHM